jgi:hypothetical protein
MTEFELLPFNTRTNWVKSLHARLRILDRLAALRRLEWNSHSASSHLSKLISIKVGGTRAD